MSPEIIKCLCELDSNNQLHPEESIENWFKRLTDIAYNIAQNPNSHPEILAILAKDSEKYISSATQEQLKQRKKVSK